MAEDALSGGRWSVPGKLMFGGEYAVLDGGCDALAVAVGELATGRLGAEDDAPTLDLRAFGERWRCPIAELPAAGIQGLLAGAFAAVAARGWPIRRNLELRFGGHHEGTKLGLGTSAAAVVAALRAGLICAGHDLAPDTFVATAHAVHHDLQGGKGSGYDIATIAAGGCVAWHAPSATLTRLSWPAGLHAAALFTGVAADTREAIEKPPTGARRAAMATAAVALRGAWVDGDVAAILAGLRGCQAAFDAAVTEQPALMSPALAGAMSFIRAHGGVARVSGAGGGDCVLAFSDDDAAMNALVQRWRAMGRLVVARLPADLFSGVDR